MPNVIYKIKFINILREENNLYYEFYFLIDKFSQLI